MGVHAPGRSGFSERDGIDVELFLFDDLPHQAGNLVQLLSVIAQRIYNLLDDLKAEKEKTYILVAHNGIARVVQSYFYEMTNEEYAAFGVENCAVVRYDF